MLGGWLFSTKSVGPNFTQAQSAGSGIGRMFSCAVAGRAFQGACQVGADRRRGVVGGVARHRRADGPDGAARALRAAARNGAGGQALRADRGHAVSRGADRRALPALELPPQAAHVARRRAPGARRKAKAIRTSRPAIRQQQQAMARRRMMAEVPKADMVRDQPHALRGGAEVHRQRHARAARGGQGHRAEVAARIRGLAAGAQACRSWTRRRSRARCYRHAELGDEIPAGLYTAVAEVLAWVYQLRRWHYSTGREPCARRRTWWCRPTLPYTVEARMNATDEPDSSTAAASVLRRAAEGAGQDRCSSS